MASQGSTVHRDGTVVHITHATDPRRRNPAFSHFYYPVIIPDPRPTTKQQLMTLFEEVLRGNWDPAADQQYEYIKIHRMYVVWSLSKSAGPPFHELLLDRIGDHMLENVFLSMASRNWIDHFRIEVAERGSEVESGARHSAASGSGSRSGNRLADIDEGDVVGE